MSAQLAVGQTVRWLLASLASFVAGVSGLLAFAVFFFSKSSGGTASTKVVALAVVAIAALVAGRLTKPKTRRTPPLGPVQANDYAGPPADPGYGSNPLPFVLAGVAVAVSIVCLILGFLISILAAVAGSELGIFVGIGIAAVGPTFLAASWVMR